MKVTRAKIRRELDRLANMVEKASKKRDADPSDDGPFVCPGIGAVGRCTNTAVYLAERLGGKVMGYAIEENPDAEVGNPEGGHDFAVIEDRWLADFWVNDYYQLPDLYDLEDPKERAEVLRRYGDPGLWTQMDSANFEYWKKLIKTQ